MHNTSNNLSAVSITLVMLLFIGCDDDRISGNKSEWNITPSEVADGGPGKDGIPALSNPPMIVATSVEYLATDALVVGYRSGSTVHAYPHAILDWHEIANVTIGSDKVAITYCPLTGSALSWSRMVNGSETTFGVSGLLYRNNLMPYDRESDSYWSQLRMDAVHGELLDTRADVGQVLETTWATWLAMYPESMITSDETGVYSTAQYAIYPYGNYRETNATVQALLPNSFDSRIFAKERVGGVVTAAKAKVYRFGSFTDSISVILDYFEGDSLVIVGSEVDNFMMIFDRRLQDGTLLTFSALQNQLPNVMEDSEGTTWDLFGRGVSGPRAGQQLDHPTTFIAFWFAWTQFYPNPLIFGEES